MDKKIEEMIALAVSYAVNCHPCLEFYKCKAIEAGLTEDEMKWAIHVGEYVRNGAHKKTREVAKQLFGADANDNGHCEVSSPSRSQD